jgi:membrane protease YdiL (CAAX protease family)
VNSSRESSNENLSTELRGFGLPGIFSILLIVLTGNVFVGNMIVLPIGAVLVLVWARLSHTPWHAIGYTKPKNWIITVTVGLLFGIAFKFFMKAILMPLFTSDPINHTYHFLVGNKAMLPAAIWAMLVAGFAEETVFRGYLFERLGKIFGSVAGSKKWIVLITSVLFGLSHYYNQGLAGVEQALITGLVFGSIFAVTGSIWMLMIAHAAFDLTALAIIYWNLESDIAHFIFK